MKRSALLLLVLLMTAACSSLNEFLYGPELPEALPMTPTFTPAPYPGPCAYTWASQGLPELEANLKAQLAEAGVNIAMVSAIAQGENCMNPDTNQVASFGHMNTVIEINVTVDDISDQSALNPTVRQILTALISAEDEMGPIQSSNKVSITFFTASERLRLSGLYPDLMNALAQSQDGDDLFPAFSVSVVPL